MREGVQSSSSSSNACLRFKSKNSSLFIFDTRRQLRMRMHPKLSDCQASCPAVLLSFCLSAWLPVRTGRTVLGCHSTRNVQRGFESHVAPHVALFAYVRGGARAEAGQRLGAASIKRSSPATARGIGCWAIGEMLQNGLDCCGQSQKYFRRFVCGLLAICARL